MNERFTYRRTLTGGSTVYGAPHELDNEVLITFPDGYWHNGVPDSFEIRNFEFQNVRFKEWTESPVFRLGDMVKVNSTGPAHWIGRRGHVVDVEPIDNRFPIVADMSEDDGRPLRVSFDPSELVLV